MAPDTAASGQVDHLAEAVREAEKRRQERADKPCGHGWKHKDCYLCR